MEWIKCSEQMPNDKEAVAVVVNGEVQLEAFSVEEIESDEGECDLWFISRVDDYHEGFLASQVSHWTPWFSPPTE